MSYDILNESADTYISILIHTDQFYTSFNDEDVEFISEPVELREFKKECKRTFGKETLKDYGAGVIELIITESMFNKFGIIASEFAVDYKIDDIIEY